MTDQERLTRFQALMHAASSETGIDLVGSIQITLADGTLIHAAHLELGNGTLLTGKINLQPIEGWQPPPEPHPVALTQVLSQPHDLFSELDNGGHHAD